MHTGDLLMRFRNTIQGLLAASWSAILSMDVAFVSVARASGVSPSKQDVLSSRCLSQSYASRVCRAGFQQLPPLTNPELHNSLGSSLIRCKPVDSQRNSEAESVLGLLTR